MRLLVLGGTVFLGRHVVETALAQGHRVSVFHRGRTGADLFGGQVERLTGDRDGGLAALGEDRTWDAVVDTSGQLPRLVRDAAVALAHRTHHYTYVSSLSVYADEQTAGQDESAPRRRLEDPSQEEVGPETFGPMKSACETAAEAAVPGRTLVVRPGLLAGPYDPSSRFAYWPLRVARGGDVLLPGPADTPCELTDARDLAAWILRCAEEGVAGAFNATGPTPAKTTFGALFEACRQASGAKADPLFVDEAFLLERHVHPWNDLPLWTGSLGPAIPTHSAAKAIREGLTFRPLVDTCRDTLAWARGAGLDEKLAAGQLGVGLAPEREAFLVAAWRGAWRGPKR